MLPRLHALLDHGVEQPRAVQMQSQPAAASELVRALQVVERQDLAALRVLQAQQAGAREVRVVRLDRARDPVQVERAVRLELERLGLDAGQHRGAAAFVLVGVRLLADDVLIAALAVRHHAEQIALGAGGHEHRRLLAQHLSRQGLQAVDGRILSVDIVANLGRSHRRAHGRRGTRNGITAQVDFFHRVRRELATEGSQSTPRKPTIVSARQLPSADTVQKAVPVSSAAGF